MLNGPQHVFGSALFLALVANRQRLYVLHRDSIDIIDGPGPVKVKARSKRLTLGGNAKGFNKALLLNSDYRQSCREPTNEYQAENDRHDAAAHNFDGPRRAKVDAELPLTGIQNTSQYVGAAPQEGDHSQVERKYFRRLSVGHVHGEEAIAHACVDSQNEVLQNTN